MPELPEVETVRKQLWSEICQKTIKKIILNRDGLRFPFPKNIKAIMQGATFTDAKRHGKYLILQCDNGYSLIIHLGMTGRFVIDNNSNYDENFYFKHNIKSEHEHIVFTLSGNKRIGYYDPRRFGYFDISKTVDLAQNKFLKKLGPDALSYQSYSDAIFENLSKLSSPIKNVLLRQDLIAGIGNIYVSEALWRSHIHPLTATNSLSEEQIRILLKHSYDILNFSIAHGGSTLKDYRHTDGSSGSFQERFSVYDREGKLCKNDDGGIIEKLTMSGRATYYCPICQRSSISKEGDVGSGDTRCM